MNKINIIIVGAKNYTNSYLEYNYTTWNNPRQADHITLVKLKQNLEKKNKKVNITPTEKKNETRLFIFIYLKTMF